MKNDITYPTTLAFISLFLLIFLIVLSVVGEKTLLFFGGNTQLAGRVYKTGYMFFGGLILSFATPLIVSLFFKKTQKILLKANPNSSLSIVEFFARRDLQHIGESVGLVIMVMFAISTIIGTIYIWISDSHI
jgi:hypothetical protein